MKVRQAPSMERCQSNLSPNFLRESQDQKDPFLLGFNFHVSREHIVHRSMFAGHGVSTYSVLPLPSNLPAIKPERSSPAFGAGSEQSGPKDAPREALPFRPSLAMEVGQDQPWQQQHLKQGCEMQAGSGSQKHITELVRGGFFPSVTSPFT